MSSGLQISQKSRLNFGRKIPLFILPALLLIMGIFGYRWYTTGQQPPLVPLPVSALALPSVDEKSVSPEQIANHTASGLKPRYISIPAIGVEKTRVFDMSIGKNRLFEFPKNIHDASWYKDGAFPGQGYGVVVVDGHNRGGSGVFANLGKLDIGDEITITRGDGNVFVYKVVESRTESINEVVASGLQRLLTPYDKSKEGLGLITYAGNWIPRDGVYDKRVLVRAVIK